MQTIFLACSESAAIDQLSNRMSIFNFIEDLHTTSFPLAFPNFTVSFITLRNQKEPETANPILSVFLEGATAPIFESPLTVNFQGKRRSRTIINLRGLVLERPGVLKVQLREKNKVIAEWSISATQSTQAELTAMASSPLLTTKITPLPTGKISKKKAAAKKK